MYKIKTKITHKICGVCGNKAIGHNFGALSCEPCKAFFRRNAFRNTLKCHFNSNCKIDEITRKFCSKCRLDKCLAIGMRRDWLPSEDESTPKTRKIHRQTDNSMGSEGLATEYSPANTSITSYEMCDENDFITEILDKDSHFSADELNAQILDLESIVTNGFEDYNRRQESQPNGYQCCENSQNSAFNSNTNSNTLSAKEEEDVSEEVIQKAVEFEFAVIPIARAPDEYRCQFNGTETGILSELFTAIDGLGVQTGQLSTEFTDLDDVQHCFTLKLDCAIRKTTRAIRRLSAFRAISISDQISLLKHGCIEMIFLTGFRNYNIANNSFHLSMNGTLRVVNFDYFKQHCIHSMQYYIKFAHKLTAVWGSDNMVLYLLIAIVLFNPDRSDLQDRDTIKTQQHVYMYLLQRYLILKYPTECEAKSRFLRLMDTAVNDLKMSAEAKKRELCDGRRKTPVGPLLRELLDPIPKPSEHMLTVL